MGKKKKKKKYDNVYHVNYLNYEKKNYNKNKYIYNHISI